MSNSSRDEIKIEYSASELSEFDRITQQMSSPDQLGRIRGRLAVRRFESKHGAEKCRAMFSVLEARGKRGAPSRN